MSSGRGHICAMTIIFALLFGCLALPVTGRSVSKLLGAKDTVGPATNTISGNINDSTVNSTTTSGDAKVGSSKLLQDAKRMSGPLPRLQPYLLEQHGAGNS
ncbi:hypothetical protein BDA96_04G033300 [Sorghum bicolor]|uniref:Uncharacterized protein n=1 Tax=Sorghum bicolor TaxID=4558 RepID=A0A921R061_SORBI|nr:hypothetical protein BDA96_04G033300 [Sorghum bicolor]